MVTLPHLVCVLSKCVGGCVFTHKARCLRTVTMLTRLKTQIHQSISGMPQKLYGQCHHFTVCNYIYICLCVGNRVVAWLIRAFFRTYWTGRRNTEGLISKLHILCYCVLLMVARRWYGSYYSCHRFMKNSYFILYTTWWFLIRLDKKNKMDCRAGLDYIEPFE